jgi:phage shock protein A
MPSMTPEQVHDELLRTKEQIEVALARLENRIVERLNALEAKINAFEAKLNALDAKINGQRILMIVAIIGVAAQIVNAWILHR